MVFSSCFFVFVFLPIVYLLYVAIPGIKLRNALLIIASIIFYAFGEPVYVLLMLGSIVLNYIMARFIAGTDKSSRMALVVAIVINIGLLVVFKYSAFLVTLVNSVARTHIPVPQIALPIGISFYTFQALSYCIDVYRDRSLVQKNLFKVMLYISFFPQLIAGPIVKYHDIDRQISDRCVTTKDGSEGAVRFIFGLSKKLIIANAMATIVDSLYATDMNMLLTGWIIAICYVLQIYFDFSGYSDMAIGLGRMFGFTFKENFNYPYISGSVQEFWRRWHISLSTWFKEYLYIPLGGNRRGERRTIINKMIVFLCTGIWHGANLTFLVWGIWHGMFLILEQKKIVNIKNKIVSHIYTMMVVIVGFVIFRADSIAQGLHILKTMISGSLMMKSEWVQIVHLMTPYSIICFLAALVLSTPVSAKLLARGGVRYVCAAVCFAMCLISLASNSYNPFIYFRF